MNPYYLRVMQYHSYLNHILPKLDSIWMKIIFIFQVTPLNKFTNTITHFLHHFSMILLYLLRERNADNFNILNPIEIISIYHLITVYFLI